MCNPYIVFVVIFPAVTGIMAGANYSGNLKDPGKSIGPGTLWAIAFSMVIYSFYSILFAASLPREMLQDDYYALQHVTFKQGFIIMGIFASTISSALGQLTGAAFVLQTMARDNILPVLKPFSYGSAKSDEPRLALLLTWAIAQACIFIPSLNQIAALVSQFYILTYFFTNFSCFVLRITGAPNFRPTFRWFSWHTALCGALLALVISFLTQPLYTGVAIVLVLVLAVPVPIHRAHTPAPFLSLRDRDR